MNKDLWDQFLAGKTGIRCDDREQYDRLMQECEKAGLKWCTGSRPTRYTPTNQEYPVLIAANCDISIEPCSVYWRKPGEALDNNIQFVPFSVIFPAPAPAPKYKVGDLFQMTRDITSYRGNVWKRGDLVTLILDDGTDCVEFRHNVTKEEHYQMWSDVSPYTAPSFPRIEITTDGKTTTATLYEGDKAVKTGTAECSPEDEFDFEKGARLALGRLIPNKAESGITVDVSINTKPAMDAVKEVNDALDKLAARVGKLAIK